MRGYEKAEYYLARLKELKLENELSYHWFARLQLSQVGILEGFEKVNSHSALRSSHCKTKLVGEYYFLTKLARNDPKIQNI